MRNQPEIIEEKITLPSEDEIPIWLTVWRPKADHPLPLVVLLPGTKGFTRWGSFPYICERIAQTGKVVVGVDYSCSGVVDFGSDITRIDLVEKDSPLREVGDIKLSLDALCKPDWADKVNLSDVTLLGHSRGSGVAILITENDKRISRLILWAAVSRFNRYTSEQIEKWKESGHHNVPNTRTGQDYFLGRRFLDEILSFSESKLKDTLRFFARPVLIIYGDKDTSVPTTESEELFVTVGPHLGKIVVIEGGDHTFGAKHPWAGTTPQLEEAISSTIEWLNQTK